MNCVNNSPCGCNGNRAGCACNGNRAGCGCNNTAVAACGCSGNRAGCGCGCNQSKIKGASFLAPEPLTVLANQPVPLVDQFNFSCGDVYHDADDHKILLSEGIYEINYNFNAFSYCDTLLTFGLMVNGLIDVTTNVVETVEANEWNVLSKTFFLSVFTSTEISLANLSSNGIEIKNLNLTIKKVSNVLVL